MNAELLQEQALEAVFGEVCAPLALQRIRSHGAELRGGWYKALLRPSQLGIPAEPRDVLVCAKRLNCERALDRSVLLSALTILQARSDIYRLGINLTATSCTDALLPEFVSDAVLARGLHASRLCIEFPETAMLSDERIIESMLCWRARGFTTAIDDVGAGYCALRAMLAGAADIVKLDACLLRDAATADSTRSFLRLSDTVRFFAGLGMTVVVEGIETPKHERLLEGLPAVSAQGFRIDVPRAWNLPPRAGGLPSGRGAPVSPETTNANMITTSGIARSSQGF